MSEGADLEITPTVGLDRWLPRYSVREYHQRAVRASPEETLAAALRVPVAPDWIVRMLFLLRGLGSGRQSIAEFASTGGFLILEQTPRSFVFGLAGGFQRGWRVAATRQEWMDWPSTGVKIVGDFRAHPADDGTSRLSTETRVQALSLTSQLVFRMYWLVVGPFSALIRRRWLRAIALAAASRA
jgi:hypothetical protein